MVVHVVRIVNAQKLKVRNVEFFSQSGLEKKEGPKMTNFEKITESTETLCSFLSKGFDCISCPLKQECAEIDKIGHYTCREFIYMWLRKTIDK